MKQIKIASLILIAIAVVSCGKSKKCYRCIDPTYRAATQADYDDGYSPKEKTGCVGEEYMQGSDGVIHHKTEAEVNDEIATWKEEGYSCEWK